MLPSPKRMTSPEVQYVPILRLGSLELEIIEEYQGDSRLLPLVEVTTKSYKPKLQQIMNAWGKANYLVSLPRYLTSYASRQKADVQEILNKFPSPQPLFAFFESVSSLGGIPVISPMSFRQQPIDYSQLASAESSIRGISNRLAFHVPVAPRELTNPQKHQLHSLRSVMKAGDILLLDVLRMRPVAAAFAALKEALLEFGQDVDWQTYVLGGLDVRWSGTDTHHNYGPLFMKVLSLDGFGDYVTSRRIEPSGGAPSKERPIKRYIPYYSSLSHDVRRFGEYQYKASVQQLQAHQCWRQALMTGHSNRCGVCADIVRGDITESPSRWKSFRMRHYINSVLTETLPAIETIPDARQLDSRGYRIASIEHA